MPRPEKVQAVDEIRGRFEAAEATFVTEYRGLTVAQQQQLRRELRQAEGEYKVFKMSLARRAVEALELEALTETLAGPTALAFAENDPVPVAKALREFSRGNEKLVIKGGLLGGRWLTPEQVSTLAEIESRDVLLSRIAGAFKAPTQKLAGLLSAMPRNAASVFSQLADKKESAQHDLAVSGQAVAEAPPAEGPAAEAAEAEPSVPPAPETPEAEKSVPETGPARTPSKGSGEEPDEAETVPADESPGKQKAVVKENAPQADADSADDPQAESQAGPSGGRKDDQSADQSVEELEEE